MCKTSFPLPEITFLIYFFLPNNDFFILTFICNIKRHYNAKYQSKFECHIGKVEKIIRMSNENKIYW